MVSVSYLELSSCETDVCLFFVSGCYHGLVHDLTLLLVGSRLFFLRLHGGVAVENFPQFLTH